MIKPNWETKRFASLSFIMFLIFSMWIVFGFQTLYPELTQYGLVPRNLVGLRGIVLSPFIHKDMLHLISNTIGLLLFGCIYALFEGKQPVRLISSIIIYSGLLHWIVGTKGLHIGMSGVIFGLYAFLLSVGYFHKKVRYLILSGFILTFYSYLIVDILPLTKGVSWTGHLTGFIVGLVISKYKEN